MLILRQLIKHIYEHVYAYEYLRNERNVTIKELIKIPRGEYYETMMIVQTRRNFEFISIIPSLRNIPYLRYPHRLVFNPSYSFLACLKKMQIKIK